MIKVASPLKSVQWNDYSSILQYSPDINFNFFKVQSKNNPPEYVDPTGRSYEPASKSSIDKNSFILIAGDIQRWSHPLSLGKIPYTGFKKKIFTTHTSGWSPWDQEAGVELALMRFRNPQNNQGTYGCYIMPRRFYQRFMNHNWSNDKYKILQEDIVTALDKKVLLIEDYEPSQYWLDNVPCQSTVRDSSTIGVALNWCQFKTRESMKKIREILIRVHNATGKTLHIKFHHYYIKDFLPYIKDLDYVKTDKYEDLYKYEFTDKYEMYLVDSTGIGYEIAYRAQKFNQKVNLFYISGLIGEQDEFLGVTDLGATPEKTHEDLINGCTTSNYSELILSETYPYSNKDNIISKITNVVMKASQLVEDAIE